MSSFHGQLWALGHNQGTGHYPILLVMTEGLVMRAQCLADAQMPLDPDGLPLEGVISPNRPRVSTDQWGCTGR